MMNKLALIATRSLRKPVLSPPALAFQRVFFLSTHKGSGTDLREQAKHVVVNNSRDSNTTESALDKEKKLYKLKRSLSDNYSRGDYEKALSDAVDLREKAYELYGPQNAVVASAINNVALMVIHPHKSKFYHILFIFYLRCLFTAKNAWKFTSRYG